MLTLKLLEELKEMVDSALPSPWRRGELLTTPATRGWTIAQKLQGEREEKKRIFSQFTNSDQGRSRKLVCTVENSYSPDEEADLICAMRNALPSLLSAAEWALEHGYGKPEYQPPALEDLKDY